MPPTDSSQDLQKQIGCMNGIFHLFDHRHAIDHRQISHRNYKWQILGCQHRLHSNKATRVPTEKPRASAESSEVSSSSSSGSSASSSIDCYRTAQSNMSENTSHIQDVVKSSMYREARGISVQRHVHSERKIGGFRYIDSPRPLQQSTDVTEKATASKGSTPVFTRVRGPEKSKEERMLLPRFSFDGRESRGNFIRTIKLKEFPRLSLDSKSCTTKGSTLEPELNFLGQGLMIKMKKSNEVLPSVSQTPPSSSIVTKLMGLDSFPDNVSSDEPTDKKAESSPCRTVAFPSRAFKTAAESKEARVPYYTPVSRRNPSSLSSARRNSNSIRTPTTCSRLPIEPAPWRQRDPTAGSLQKIAQNRKGSTADTQLSTSVYGEIEKRITELEFKRAGNNLRALKQILGAIQNIGERQENWAELTIQNDHILEGRCSNQNFKLLMRQNRKTYQNIPTIKGTCCPKQLGSTSAKTKSTEVMENAKSSSSSPDTQRVQPHSPKSQKENPGYRSNAKDITPRRNSQKQHGQHSEKKSALHNILLDQTLKATQSIRAAKCTTSGRDSTTAGSKLQQKVPMFEGELPSSPNPVTIKMHYIKNGNRKCSQNRKHETKAMDLHLTNEMQRSMISSSNTSCSNCQGDAASLKSESNNSLELQKETDGTNLIKFMNSSYKEQQATLSTSKDHKQTAEFTVNTVEQPSPVSVLDSIFYSEETPSPVEKMATAFRDGSSCTPNETEMHAENLIDYCTRNHPSLFHTNIEETGVLVEEASGEAVECNGWMNFNQKIQGRIVSDVLNETLAHRITLGEPFTDERRWIRPYRLIKEVSLETDHQSKMLSCNRNDQDDRLSRLLASDSKYPSDDWTTYKGEVPWLVLDIERLIFKDLINEVVKGEIMSHCNQLKRRCQQLCTKQYLLPLS